MSHARCCECQPGEPSCCEQAGGSWWNRYCVKMQSARYYWLQCDCQACDNQPISCEECVEDGYFCCGETEFNVCISGALFRRPYTDGLCDAEQTNSAYTPCPDPWVAPDWGVEEGGVNSYYSSPSDDLNLPPGGCDLCLDAPTAARIRFHCNYRREGYAGTCTDDDIDESYVIEGKASLYCANPPSECEVLCSCDEDSLPAPTHILKIEPCEDAPTGLATPPTFIWYANLDNKTPPHLATWTLGKLDGDFLSSVYCDLIEPAGTAPEWCYVGVGQFCYPYTSGESWEVSEPTFSTYPCVSNNCVVS